MKKWIMSSLAILLGILSISIPLAGVRTAEAGTTEDSGKKLKIVTTIFPEYDWTRAVLGDREADVDLTMLLDNGTDLHSFQPAVKDIMKVSSCDLLIYVGGESDQWIEDALESAQNKDMKTINLMEVLGDTIKEEENVEGMQESGHGHEDEDEKEYDEHVWTSLRNASVICGIIAETLEEMDPEIKMSMHPTQRLIRKNFLIWIQNTRIQWTARNRTHFSLQTALHSAIWWMITD